MLKIGVYLHPRGYLVLLEHRDYWEFLEECEYLGPL
jgi:hypothetical protein